MTPRQQRFVEEYLVDLNATQAAIRAGYSAKSACEQASVLLRNPKVAAAVAARASRVTRKAEVTVERVLDELETLGFSDIGEILDFSGDRLCLRSPSAIPERARRAISAVKVKRYVEGHGEEAQTVEVTEFKLWSKDAALEKLGKYLKMFVERHEHTGKDGTPLLSLDAVRAVVNEAPP